MVILGYYAIDSNKDLHQFEWGEDDTFYLIKNGEKIKADPNDYEVLEIGHTTADD